MSELRPCICCDCRFAPPRTICPVCGIRLLLSDAETAALVDATDEDSVGDDEPYIRKPEPWGCTGMALPAALIGIGLWMVTR